MDEKYHLLNGLADSFLYLMPEKGIWHLIDICSGLNGQSYTMLAEELKTTFSMDEGDLLEAVKVKHFEHVSKYIQVFLWKQKNGLISQNVRLNTCLQKEYIASEYHSWLIHIYMVLNDYPEMQKECFYHPFTREFLTYESQVDLSIDKIYEADVFEDDWYSWLFRNACLFGKGIKKYSRYKNLLEIYNYVKEYIVEDSKLGYLSLSSMTFFMYLTEDSSESAWNVFKEIIGRNQENFSDFAAYVLGFRLFGNKVRSQIKDTKDISEIGGIEAFKKLFEP
jgi:hypothetical protein